MESLAQIRKTLDALDWVVTLLLVIFLDVFYGAFYRITKGDTNGLIYGIIWLVTGGLLGIGWIIDIVCVVTKKKITFLA